MVEGRKGAELMDLSKGRSVRGQQAYSSVLLLDAYGEDRAEARKVLFLLSTSQVPIISPAFVFL